MMYGCKVGTATIFCATSLALVSAQEINRNTQLLVGVIAGVGGLAIGVMIVVLVIICRQRRKAKRNSRTSIPYRLRTTANKPNNTGLSFENQQYSRGGQVFSLPRVQLGSTDFTRADSKRSRSRNDWRRSFTEASPWERAVNTEIEAEPVSGTRETKIKGSRLRNDWRRSFTEASPWEQAVNTEIEPGSGTRNINHVNWRNSLTEDTFHRNISNFQSRERTDAPRNWIDTHQGVTSPKNKMDYSKSKRMQSDRIKEGEYSTTDLHEGWSRGREIPMNSIDGSLPLHIPRVKLGQTGF